MLPICSRTKLHRLAAALVLALPAAQPARAAALPRPTAAAESGTHAVAPRSSSRTVTATNCANSGTGSLRDLYENAQDYDTIDLSKLTCSRITLSSQMVTSAYTVTVVAGPAGVVIDASGKDRAFVHNGNGQLGLVNLTVTNGSYAAAGVPSRGGCIFSNGAYVYLKSTTVSHCAARSLDSSPARGGAIYGANGVFLEDSQVLDGSVYTLADQNHTMVASEGGGIWAGGAVHLNRSTVSGNTASTGPTKYQSRGGGVFAYVAVGGATYLDGSTVSGNTAAIGGGIYTTTLVMSNGTVSGNKGLVSIGGVFAGLYSNIVSSTVAMNVADRSNVAGAELFGQAKMYSTILAHNIGTNQREEDLDADRVVGSNNLIMYAMGVVPADTIIADPMLGPLQFNGGPTQTHAPQPGSPAIDHGANRYGAPYDQRGAPYARVVNNVADIGAYETGNGVPRTADAIFADGFDPPPP